MPTLAWLFWRALALAAIALVGFVVVFVVKLVSAKRQLRSLPFPGPKDSGLLFGVMGELRRRFHGNFNVAIAAWAREYGAAFKIRVLTRPMVILTDGEFAYSMLIKEPQPKPDMNKRFQKVFGKGTVFATDGDEWKTRRRHMSHGYSVAMLDAFVPTFIKHGERLVRVLREKLAATGTGVLEIDLMPMFFAVTMDIIADVGMRLDLDTVEGNNMHLHAAVTEMLTVSPTLNMPLGEYLTLFIKRKSRRMLYDTFQQALERGQADPLPAGQPARDFLDVILAECKGPESLSKQDLMDEMLTLFFAGHETTANTLTWVFSELVHAHNEPIVHRLREEVAEVCNQKSASSLTGPRIRQLKYMEQTLNETLRMYSPVSGTVRQLSRDMRLPSGETLPKDLIVMYTWTAAHRDPKYYDRPETFDPEHFAPEVAHDRPPLAFAPFSAGPRSCAGTQFFWQESRAILALLLEAFDFDEVPGFVAIPGSNAPTLRSENGIRVRLRERQHA